MVLYSGTLQDVEGCSGSKEVEETVVQITFGLRPPHDLGHMAIKL